MESLNNQLKSIETSMSDIDYKIRRCKMCTVRSQLSRQRMELERQKSILLQKMLYNQST